jgi:hypothetical protein
VWYETVDLERLLKQFGEEAVRKRVEQRVKKLRARSVADHDFPQNGRATWYRGSNQGQCTADFSSERKGDPGLQEPV